MRAAELAAARRAAAQARCIRRWPRAPPREKTDRRRRQQGASPEACRRTTARRQFRALFRIVRGRSSCGRRTLAGSALLHQPSAMSGRYAKVMTAKLAGARRFCRRAPLLTYQPACKPGSVWPAARAANVTAIPLARRLPGASSNLPERLIRTDPGLLPRRSYSVLLPVGFAVPLPSPETRCALTAPFHPCRG